LLPGDGIGAEVMRGPAELLEATRSQVAIEVTGVFPVGSTAFAESGELLPRRTVAACEDADAILLGAIGDHPGVDLNEQRSEAALLDLRAHFDLRVSIRQVWRGDGQPLAFVRNLLGGAYGLQETHTESDGLSPASDLIVLEPGRIEEVANIACDLAFGHSGTVIISADKANLWATGRLWRRIAGEVATRRGVPILHRLIDRSAFELAQRELPNAVIMTEGIFGDILSDLAAGRAGSIALCSSASVHPGAPARGRCVGIFEPVHGTAPHLVGTHRANPVGAYLALAALGEWFPETVAFARAVRLAVDRALHDGPWTRDLAPVRGVAATTEAVATRINRYCIQVLETGVIE
jgi:isocitrate/isopropylmalate dehydrogenase